ncbi:merozoite surface protein 7 [Plasmodium cynomolgi strain B]|uniref:Merozoite surface protein 7 n=2 Tax=Plasmodium cynomolgi TaxID=5827 RepID=K6UYM5_PLACD|nr:merozoite surface protein 7 [Plasmodium cynomolgi strain B]GAB67715.1 merozoite surface protein 7 [Plasmodium cynomolgi strain B]
MRKNIFLVCSILVFLSLQYVLAEKLGFKKKRKKIEGNVLTLMKRRLAILQKLNSSDKSEVFAKEIESIKERINMLKQRGWENPEESFCETLEEVPNCEVGEYADMVKEDQGNLTDSEAEFLVQEEIKHEGSVGGEEVPGDVKSGEVVGKAASKAGGTAGGTAGSKKVGKAGNKQVRKAVSKEASKVAG